MMMLYLKKLVLLCCHLIFTIKVYLNIEDAASKVYLIMISPNDAKPRNNRGTMQFVPSDVQTGPTTIYTT